MSSLTHLEAAIKTILGRSANELGDHTGFIQRVRKFTGASFAQMLVLGSMQYAGQASFSDLAHFATHSGLEISKQGVEQRLGERAARFLQAVLESAFTQLLVADPVAIPLLKRFASVIVEDSTTIPLPDALEDVWRGCGGSENGKGTKSSFKVQVRWDLLAGALEGLALQAGHVSDQDSVLKGRRRGRGSLRISDLGYFDTQEMQRESEDGEYWLSRLHGGPIKLYDEQGQELDLLTILSQVGKQGYECWVQVTATRRLHARLLAIPVPEEVAIQRRTQKQRAAQKHGRRLSPRQVALAQWTILITNVPSELLSLSEALVLLRLRWQIEMLFKLWKQYGKLEQTQSEKPWTILCEIFAKLIGLLLLHWMTLEGCWSVPNRSLVKATKALRSQAVLIAKALRKGYGLRQALQEMTEGIKGCCMDTRCKHPNASQLLLAPPPLPGSTTNVGDYRPPPTLVN